MNARERALWREEWQMSRREKQRRRDRNVNIMAISFIFAVVALLLFAGGALAQHVIRTLIRALS